MARPRRHADAEILAVARAVFLEHGPSASLQLVADRVGMSQPALFKRFGTKAAFLLRALAPQEDWPWVERLRAGPDARPLPEQLYEICLGAMHFFALAIPSMMTLRASGLDLRPMAEDRSPTGPLAMRAALMGWFQAAHARGLVRAVDASRVDLILVGSLQARALMAHMAGETLDSAEIAAHAAAVTDLLWNGLRPLTKDLYP